MILTIDTSSHSFRLSAFISLFIFGAVLGASGVYSWTGPTGTPPDGNVEAPLNVGTLSQIKDGALSVNGFSNVGSSYIEGNLGIDVTNPVQKVHVNGRVRATGFCIGTSCITSWPTAGSHGAATWTGWQANGTAPNCAAGRVIVGLGIQKDPTLGITHFRLNCRVVTP
jgi:hypothetical protein